MHIEDSHMRAFRTDREEIELTPLGDENGFGKEIVLVVDGATAQMRTGCSSGHTVMVLVPPHQKHRKCCYLHC